MSSRVSTRRPRISSVRCHRHGLGLRRPSRSSRRVDAPFCDASSSHVLVLTSGVFPDAFRAPGLHPPHPPPWSLSALRRMNSRSDSRRLGLRLASELPGLPPPAVQRPRGFAPPRRFVPRLPPRLVSCGYRPWASVLRRFLPVRSPGSLSARGVLRVVIALARDRLRGFGHRADACRRFA